MTQIAEDPKKKLYLASALFNARECYFNLELNKRLEEKGYSVFLPQRDGLELLNVAELLQSEFKLTPDEVSKCYSWLIYLIDLGVFLANSDVCLACLDEDLDPGVLVEIMFARMMGKPVIAYRTERRASYGVTSEIHGGMHFSQYFNCDKFITFPEDRLRSIESG